MLTFVVGSLRKKAWPREEEPRGVAVSAFRPLKAEKSHSALKTVEKTLEEPSSSVVK